MIDSSSGLLKDRPQSGQAVDLGDLAQSWASRWCGAPRRLALDQELEDYEQELVDQYLLAAVGAGMGDAGVGGDRAAIFEFIRFTGRPVWTARPSDADRFLAHQRKELGRARLTVQNKAWALAHFFDFLVVRYQGDIHVLTGRCVA